MSSDDKDKEKDKCYLRGTRVLTPTGERSVEDLAIGDLVVTRFSGMLPIRWIARQSFAAPFVQANRAKHPVCFTAGSLGANTPARDLMVSPGHSMLIDGILMFARDLVNGGSIRRETVTDDLHYYQFDLGVHDCVIAEGTWSESYGDDGERDQFHNVEDFYALNLSYTPPDTLVLCAPRPEKGAKWEAVLRPLVERATAQVIAGPLAGFVDQITAPWRIRGWAFDAANPDLPVILELLAGKRVIGTALASLYRADLEHAGYGQGRCGFDFIAARRLRNDMIPTLRVRRVSDGAVLPMADGVRSSVDDVASQPTPTNPVRLLRRVA